MEFHYFQFSPNITRQIELRRMRRDGNLTHMGQKRNAYSFRCENLKEGESLEDLDIGKRVIRN